MFSRVMLLYYLSRVVFDDDVCLCVCIKKPETMIFPKRDRLIDKNVTQSDLNCATPVFALVFYIEGKKTPKRERERKGHKTQTMKRERVKKKKKRK